jgi:glutamine amidotransferase
MGSAIAIVDYGMGNIRSVINALREVESDGVLVSDPGVLVRQAKLILPGVGAFGEAMDNLRASGIDQALEEARRSGAMILGICLGMQLMFRTSEEGEAQTGLGWIEGAVTRFPDLPGLRVPHMGWNDLKFERDHPLREGVDSGADVYFLHSFRCSCEDDSDVLATAEHGARFVAMLARANLLGIQFHPEKSQLAGLRMLRNFARA